ncbi:MAG: histidinol-phosphatase [Roseburia sp.]|nr:histidinol-phosphatase [Roseburia sp.]
MKTNFHTHVKRCRHAGGDAEDYVRCAIENGLSQLGFSDHAPFADVDFGMRMPYSELWEYLGEVDAVRDKYGSKITVWKGLEIEYLPEYRRYYEELLTEYGVEYLLLGEHFYKDAAGNNANIYEAHSTEQCLSYARSVAEGMKTGFFKAVAHPDLYMLNMDVWDDNCARAADLIIDTAVATDTVLEYNANGLRRPQTKYSDGLRHPYPHDTFWKMAAGTSVRAIVNSDCHSPKDLWDEAMERAHRNLRELGIKPIEELL